MITKTFSEVNAALTDDERRVIALYAKNNMRICETAKDAFYHKRTVHAKLNDVQRKTDLNPRVFYDLVLLVFAISEKGGIENAI